MKNLKRTNLSHNLVSYYEGYEIDYADYDNVMNSLFFPFARDSEGGVAGFFYLLIFMEGEILYLVAVILHYILLQKTMMKHTDIMKI